MSVTNTKLHDFHEKLNEYRALVEAKQFGFEGDFREEFLGLVSLIDDLEGSEYGPRKLIDLSEQCKNVLIDQLQKLILQLVKMETLDQVDKLGEGASTKTPTKKQLVISDLKTYLMDSLRLVNPQLSSTGAIYQSFEVKPRVPVAHHNSYEKVQPDSDCVQKAINAFKTALGVSSVQDSPHLRHKFRSAVNAKFHWRDPEFRASRGLNKIITLLQKTDNTDQVDVMKKIGKLAGAYMGRRHREKATLSRGTEIPDTKNDNPNQLKLAEIFSLAQKVLSTNYKKKDLLDAIGDYSNKNHNLKVPVARPRSGQGAGRSLRRGN